MSEREPQQQQFNNFQPVEVQPEQSALSEEREAELQIRHWASMHVQ